MNHNHEEAILALQVVLGTISSGVLVSDGSDFSNHIRRIIAESGLAVDHPIPDPNPTEQAASIYAMRDTLDGIRQDMAQREIKSDETCRHLNQINQALARFRQSGVGAILDQYKNDESIPTK